MLGRISMATSWGADPVDAYDRSAEAAATVFEMPGALDAPLRRLVQGLYLVPCTPATA